MPVWLILLVVLSRTGLGVLAFFHPSRFLRPDSYNYLQLASNVWHHGVFSLSSLAPYAPETFRVPGYPFYLGFWSMVFKLSLSWVITIQCVAGLAGCLLLWRWLREESLASHRAVWGTLALAFDPVIFFHTPLILAETLFLVMITAAAYATWKGFKDQDPLQWGIRGFLWGLASLVRPVSLYLPLFISVACLRSRKILVSFLLCAYLFPLLWCARNYHVAGSFSFTSQGGIDLLKYPAPAIISMATGRTFQDASDFLKAPIDAEHPTYASPFEQSRLYGRRALEVITAHPILFARFCLHGTARILFGSAFEMFFEMAGIPSKIPYPAYHAEVAGQSTRALLSLHRWLIPFYAAYMAALLVLYGAFGWGIWNLMRSGRRLEGRFLLGSVLYFVLLSSPLGHYRFRIPIMPFLIVGAVLAGAKSIGDRISRTRQ